MVLKNTIIGFEVLLAFYNKGFGNYVAIEHPQTTTGEIYVSIYAHLKAENIGNIKVGDTVDINNPIGVMGSSGLSTGQHLHFQIEDKTRSRGSYEFYGRSIDPTLLIGQTTSNLKTQVEVEEFCDGGEGSGSTDNLYGGYNSIFDIDQPEIDLSLDRYENVITHESKLKAVKPNITFARSTQDGDGVELYGLSMFSGINNVQIKSFKQDKCNENLEKWSIPYFDSCKVTKNNINNSTATLNGIELSFDLYNRDTERVKQWDIKTARPFNSEDKTGKYTTTIYRDFNEDDRVCSKVKAIESIQFEGVSFRIGTSYENDMQLWGGCYDVEDSIKAITDSFWVSGGFWNYTDKLKNDRVETNRANREINVRGGERLENNRFVVPKNARVWIVSHGWNDESNNSDTWKSIAESIEQDDPNAIALRLDWSNASYNGKHEWEEGSADTVMSLGFDSHCKAATWIAPVVDELKNKLDYWGVKAEQMYTVGHSLGSLLNAELASRYNTLIEKQISLDPPSEWGCKEGYSIRNGNGNIWKADYEAGEKRKDFSNKAKVSYSFVGRHSGAGSQPLAKTADRSFWVEFDSWTTNGDEHGWVVDTFKLINSSDKLTNGGTIPKGYLSSADTTSLSNLQEKCGNPGLTGEWQDRAWECHHGIIEVGNPRDNSKKTMNRWNHKRKFVENGDVEHMFIQTVFGDDKIYK